MLCCDAGTNSRSGQSKTYWLIKLNGPSGSVAPVLPVLRLAPVASLGADHNDAVPVAGRPVIAAVADLADQIAR